MQLHPAPFIFELPMPDSLRLHAAAMQLSAIVGKPTPASNLARQLLLHACTPSTWLAEHLARLRPDYVPLAYTGNVKHRAGKDHERLVVPITAEGKTLIKEQAIAQECTMLGLLREQIADLLPAIPASAE